MLKRNWALVAFVYLALAEALSLVPVPDLTLCLVKPEHSRQAANNDNPKYCPAFHTGAELVLKWTDHFLEAHDKSVIGGFTIVLAISTIGLWLATNKLWAAGEKQFGVVSEGTAAQSRDMQASIAASEKAATAAQKSADTAEKALVAAHQPFILMETIEFGEPEPDGTPNIDFVIGNDGNGAAIILKIWGRIHLIERTPAGAKSYEDPWEGVVGTSIPAGKTSQKLSITVRRINKARFQRILEGQIEFFIDIKIGFTDIFKNPIESPFSFTFDVASRRFIRDSAVKPNPETGGKRHFQANPKPPRIT